MVRVAVGQCGDGGTLPCCHHVHAQSMFATRYNPSLHRCPCSSHPHSLLTTSHSLLTTSHSPLTTSHSLLTLPPSLHTRTLLCTPASATSTRRSRDHQASVQRSGWLVKQGGRIKTWKRRWCILTKENISYFTNKVRVCGARDCPALGYSSCAYRRTARRVYLMFLSSRQQPSPLSPTPTPTSTPTPPRRILFPRARFH
jgi:guanine nucleotide exchange factor for Rho/Rac/Cdc42-like GTPase family protein